jgi:hypothetical protein
LYVDEEYDGCDTKEDTRMVTAPLLLHALVLHPMPTVVAQPEQCAAVNIFVDEMIVPPQ